MLTIRFMFFRGGTVPPSVYGFLVRDYPSRERLAYIGRGLHAVVMCGALCYS